MGLAAQARAAIGSLTILERAARGASREELAGGLAFYPLVGLVVGALAAAAAAAVPRAGGIIGFALLELLAGPRGPLGLAAAAEGLLRGSDGALHRLRARPGLLGGAVAAAALVAKCSGLVLLPPPARTGALLLTPLLGTWAVVVQCYGGTPLHARGSAAALVGRARFREFGWASLVAIGVTLAYGEAVGLVVVIVAALVTIGIRVRAHRVVGGLTGRLLAATRELVETMVVVVLSLLTLGT